MAESAPTPPPASHLAVWSALLANVVLAIAKVVAWLFTGSASMLSEGLHSLADSVSQISLVIGIAESRRRPDAEHPYGYGRSRWAWALISAVGVFFVGAGVSAFNGVERLLSPEPIEHLGWALGVLIAAAVLEGVSFGLGLRSVVHAARAEGVSVAAYLRHGRDPMAVAVVFEDGTAVVGVALATLALALTGLTGEPVWDAIGSIALAVLLALSAVFLVRRNLDLLIGRAIPEAQRRSILAVLAEHGAVEEVIDVKTTVLGADQSRFKAEIEVDGRAIAQRWMQRHPEEVAAMSVSLEVDPARLEAILGDFAEEIVDQLGAEIDRLEERIREVAPDVQHIDLEVDSGGE